MIALIFGTLVMGFILMLVVRGICAFQLFVALYFRTNLFKPFVIKVSLLFLIIFILFISAFVNLIIIVTVILTFVITIMMILILENILRISILIINAVMFSLSKIIIC
jgi:hypothetical protein